MTMEESIQELIKDYLTNSLRINLFSERHNNGVKIEVELTLDEESLYKDYTEIILD